MFPSVNEQMDIIRSGIVELLPENEMVKKIEDSIKNNEPLVVKLGADPSRPDLHIGHAVVLNKMRQFQDLGHHALLIIGDFTAMIGDPTGRSKTRPQLTVEETRENGRSYLEQAVLVLEKEDLEVRYNSEWLDKLAFSDVINLAGKYTVAQLLERDDFNKRFKEGIPISVHELLYPLAQAYDSFAIKSDIELGGTDQKFNLIVGREIQRAYGAEPQCVLIMPILEGTDGVEKMSKSLNNYIALTDSPRDMFGKAMSVPDNLTVRYYRYGAFPTLDKVEEMKKGLETGSYHPRNAKVDMAKAIVARYHGQDAAIAAFEEFERMFVHKDLPDEIEEAELQFAEEQPGILDVLTIANLAPSKKEARRLIEQGGVSIDGEKISDPFYKTDFTDFRLLKVGKRKFLKIKKI